MVRSLYAGISGLRNHQVGMDVTGNNIANVNTVGFKAGRVTFEESMAQLLQGSSRPAGNAGGTNPLQVGLGMSVGSIDTILTQGNLQTTGHVGHMEMVDFTFPRPMQYGQLSKRVSLRLSLSRWRVISMRPRGEIWRT